jgi:hypothetical protein
LADPEKATMIYSTIAVWQTRWAAIPNSVLEVYFEISGVTKLGLSHMEAKCECGKSKFTDLLSAPKKEIFQKY